MAGGRALKTKRTIRRMSPLAQQLQRDANVLARAAKRLERRAQEVDDLESRARADHTALTTLQAENAASQEGAATWSP